MLTFGSRLRRVDGFGLSIRTADAALEVIDEADARLALEGTRLDVFLGHFEAGEVGVVFVFGDARVADPAALTGCGQNAHRKYADQTKHAGQDRTGHQIVLLEAEGAPLIHAGRARKTRNHALMTRTQQTRPLLRTLIDGAEERQPLDARMTSTACWVLDPSLNN